MRIERPLILRRARSPKMRQTPRDMTTFRSRRKRADRLGDRRREVGGRLPVPPPCVVGVAVCCLEAGARERLLRAAGRPASGSRRAADRAARGTRPDRPGVCRVASASGLSTACRMSAASIANCGCLDGSVVRETPRGRRGRRRRRLASRSAARRHATRPSGRAGRARGSGAAPAGATSRRSSSAASPPRRRRSPSCANTSATSSSSRATAAADPQRLIERLVDQPRHLGVVRQLEARIDVRFERKLAQQRQAEGVDRGDGDVAEAILEIAPPRQVELRDCGSPRAAARRSARASRPRPCG